MSNIGCKAKQRTKQLIIPTRTGLSSPKPEPHSARTVTPRQTTPSLRTAPIGSLPRNRAFPGQWTVFGEQGEG